MAFLCVNYKDFRRLCKHLDYTLQCKGFVKIIIHRRKSENARSKKTKEVKVEIRTNEVAEKISKRGR